METRQLGGSGLTVSAMGFGCMGLSGAYGAADEGASIATITAAVEHGVTLFDTGDFYGNGHNERLVGRALAPVRDRVAIATKTGVIRRPDGMSLDGSPAYLRQACEASLERLGTDRVDVLYLARRDPKTPIEESVAAMAELKAEGKIGAIGLSEVSAATIRRAHAEHPIAAVQLEYSLTERSPEGDVLPTLRELGIALVAYSPLGRGLLGGGLRSAADFADNDFRRLTPRFQGENLERNLTLVDALAAIAAERGVTPAQLALAWVCSRGEDVIPIPGTRSAERLAENLAATGIELTADELERLDTALPAGAAAGERYPASAMHTLDR